MQTTEINGTDWACIETSSLDKVKAVTDRLSDGNIDCFVDVRNADQVDGRWLLKYSIAVPYANKHDLLQIDMAYNADKKEDGLTAEQKRYLHPDMKMNMVGELKDGKIIVVDVLHPYKPLYVVDRAGQIMGVDQAFGIK